MPKVSIILPVYNVEEFLEQSLQSLINQTLKDIEIICVNDGSTDNSQEILEKYAKQDSRIKIINQTNQGQGKARNNGLQHATGEYIGFLDPDDWVMPEMFENLYNASDNCDLIESSYTLHNEPRNYVKVIKHSLNLPKNKPFNWKIKNNYAFSNKLAVWNKLYRTSFISKNNIHFMDIPRGEDIFFTVSSRICASKIKYIDCPDYQYRIKKDNRVIISENNREKDINSIDFTLLLKQEFIKNNIFSIIENDFNTWSLKLLYNEYKTVSAEQKVLFIKTIESKLGKDFCNKFKSKFLFKELINTLFSIYNTTRDNQKYKIFKILGIEIKIKYGH